jgi:SAM-dependent methyltransferase
MKDRTIFSHVLAPAPRLLMRLALIPELLDLLHAAPRRILEIGPGLGDLSMYLASRFPQAASVLTDISEHGAGQLRERAATHPGMTVLTCDFRTLPAAPRYDLVVACEVFEHIEDDASAFAAVHRLLDDGGYFLFSVPAFMANWGAADVYAGHYRRYERAPMLAQFARHGFTVERTLCYGFPLTQMLWLAYKIYYGRLVARAPLAQHEATKRSGTERKLVSRFRKLPVAALMAPLLLCQQLAKKRNLGDGYLVLARKNGPAAHAPA